MASQSKDTWWRNNGILKCPLTCRSRYSPSLEEHGSYVGSHCDCMYALACLREARHSRLHTPERKYLTQIARTQLRRCLLFPSLWHYRGQHRSDGVNNRQSSLHFAAACWTHPSQCCPDSIKDCPSIPAPGWWPFWPF
jgi:hypothetical protein